MRLEDLEGKRIKSIETCVYKSSLFITFDDGTQLKLTTGSTGCHNDRWMTIEHEIINA